MSTTMLSKHFAVLGNHWCRQIERRRADPAQTSMRGDLPAVPARRHNEYCARFATRVLCSIAQSNCRSGCSISEETVRRLFPGRPARGRGGRGSSELIPQARATTPAVPVGDRVTLQAQRSQDHRLHGDTPCLTAGPTDRADRRPHGQAREPLLGMIYHKLMQASKPCASTRATPHVDNANVGGDTMSRRCALFRLPADASR